MKKCPTCNSVYDDAIRFCLEDGATLERTDQSGGPTMTMPAQPAFRPPPAPTLTMPAAPSMSTGRTLLSIFIAPARAFASFRDISTFSPAVVRFLIGAAIILVAVLAHHAIYLARVGQENISRAALEASPQTARLPAEDKERALRLQQTPTLLAINWVVTFGTLIGLTLASLPLGALIYWLGAMLFKHPIKYMQALLVWTYATLPATVLWATVNMLVLFVRPPSTNVAIAIGAGGVFRPNPGSLFTVESLPLPVHVVALSNFDLFAFYGLALAILGLRRVARLPWIGSFGIVIFVWLLGVIWRVSTAGLISALLR